MPELSPDLQAMMDAGDAKLREVQESVGWIPDDEGGCDVNDYIEALESCVRELGITHHLRRGGRMPMSSARMPTPEPVKPSPMQGETSH